MHIIRYSIGLLSVVGAIMLAIWDGGASPAGAACRSRYGASRAGQAAVPTSTRPPTPSIAAPTSTPTSAPPTRPPDERPTGGWIELRAQFPQDWPWDKAQWQELWTVVQWQDSSGNWRDVDGWRGTLDSIAPGGSGEVVGHKSWWVAQFDLGRGPFRWLVYRGKDGDLFAVSDPFHLPDRAGATVPVDMPVGVP